VHTLFRNAILAVAFAAAVPLVADAGQNPPTLQDLADRRPNPSQPDFTVVNLPSTLRVPRFKSAFRVTHRFTRTLGAGDFGDLASDFFGIDAGAVIGLEYRFGLMRGLQIGILRTSDRTIDLFTQYSLMRARGAALDIIASVDGTDNFTDSYTPSIGAALSYELGTRGAVYAEPMWVNNSNPFPALPGEDNDTFLLGFGARLRIRPTVYLVGEFIPRVAGHRPGVDHGTFGIEKRAGGHVFQLNFSNGLGNTIGQLSRGGTGQEDWYLGFNISRKFF
jgi:hypothetical protein